MDETNKIVDAILWYLNANYPCHCGNEEDCPRNYFEAETIYKNIVEPAIKEAVLQSRGLK